MTTKADGWNKARHAWICRLCGAWHDTKPTECASRGCLAGQKDLLHFDSKGEAQRFAHLMFLQEQGEITALRHHPRYALHALAPGGKPVQVATYEADSVYRKPWRDGLDETMVIVEDYKPGSEKALDPTFKLKRRWFEAQYGIEIKIVS